LEEQSAIELIEELETKVQQVHLKKAQNERKLQFLSHMQSLIDRFGNNPAESKHLLQKVNNEKKKHQESLETFQQYRRTLMHQVIKLKEAIYPKAKAIADFIPSEDTTAPPATSLQQGNTMTVDNPQAGLLTFKKGDIFYIMTQGDNGIWRGEHTETGIIGFFPASHVQLLSVGRVEKRASLQLHSNYSPVEDAREALGEVNRLEKLTKLSKFFGTSTNHLEKSSEEEKHEREKREKREKKKNKKRLQQRIKELEKEAKEWEAKYHDIRKLLQKMQSENQELLKENSELRQKMKLQ
jgi:hypothetical protein